MASDTIHTTNERHSSGDATVPQVVQRVVGGMVTRRYLGHLALGLLIVLLAILVGSFLDSHPVRWTLMPAVPAEQLEQSAPPGPTPEVPILAAGGPFAIKREVAPFTIVPDRPVQTIGAYTVQSGDTVFGIAEAFGLDPTTIFWANSEILQDSVHLLYPGQELRIPPVDGVIHRVLANDTLESIAAAYGVTARDIIDSGHNPLRDDDGLEEGMLVMVPGGEREMVAWRPPVTVAGTDSYDYGGNTGACSGAYAGFGGTGIFTWPTDRHHLSGYNYGIGHGGIDLSTALGDPIYAADGGVVVYSGWNTWGYGNLIIINHGNGYQTFYAHLSSVYYGCGAYVERGTVIGAAGSTGRSTGPHLHFEIRYDWVPANPWGYMP